MNSPQGKLLLATVRQGDYAHAGEEEAIDLVWQHLPKNAAAPCLDAGCGRGGTAHYVRSRGWARVTGVDIDAESITGAAAKYADNEFRAGDIVTVGKMFPARFEIVYALNAFYAFPDQARALRALADAAAPGAALSLFDYVDLGGYAATEFARIPDNSHWKPMKLSAMPALLSANGWSFEKSVDLNAEYLRWYEGLVERFAERRPALLERFPVEIADIAANYYASLLDSVRTGAMGGAIVLARKTS
jgi:SAM-dependent methyltransferase